MRKILLLFVLLLTVKFAFSLTLEEAIQTAIKRDISLKRAQISKKISFIDHNNSLLALLPDFNASFKYSKMDTSGIKNYERSYTFSQPIFYNGKEIFDYLASLYSFKSSKNIAEDSKKNVVINTIRNYLELLKAKYMVDVWKMELSAANDSYKKTKKMYEYGKVTKLDLLETENYYNSVFLSKKVAEHNYLILKMAFEKYLNKKIDKISDYDFGKIRERDEKFYLKYAKKHSNEYKNLLNNYKSAKFSYWASQLSRLPSVSFFITHTNGGNDGFSDTTQKDTIYGININLTGLFYSSASGGYNYHKNDIGNSAVEGYNGEINILTGDYKTNSVLRSKLSYLEAKDKIENRMLVLEKLIKEKYFSFEEKKLAFANQKVNLEANKENFKKKAKEYELGMIEASDKIDAQQKYAKAKVDYINSKYNFYISWFELLQVSGIDFTSQFIDK